MLKLAAETAEPGMLQVVLMGLITVFVVLVCLIIIIKALGAVMAKANGNKNDVPVSAVPSPAAAAPVQASGSDKRRMVAAIAAAIAEDMGSDVDHIRIHSIRRL